MKSSRKPTEPSPTNRNEQQQRRRGRRGAGDQLGQEVAEDARQHDDQPAHGRGAALDVVAGRAVVADQLAVAALGQYPDREPGADEGEDQGETACEQDRSHLSGSSRSSDASRRLDDPLECRAARGLDEDHVGRPDSLAQQVHRLVHVLRVEWRRPTPSPPRRSRRPRGRPRRGRRCRARPRGARPRVLLRGGVAELAHLAEDGDRAGAGTAPDAGQGRERSAHRVGVGVVGVVDHADVRRAARAAPSATSRAP